MSGYFTIKKILVFLGIQKRLNYEITFNHNT